MATPTETPAPEQTTDAQGPKQESTPFKPELIVYDLPQQATAANDVQSLITSTAAKHAARAARFGTAVKPVSEVSVLGARRAAARQGFISGLDPSTQSAQKQSRLERFGAIESAPNSMEQPANDEDIRKKRRERFGAVDLSIYSNPLEKRRDVEMGEVIRENVVHLFGVDEMSTEDVVKYFEEFGPSWVEWLNDSSCNVAFEDGFSMKRALRGVDMEGGEREDFEWRVARAVQRGNGWMPIWIRAASEGDRRPEKPNPKSKWSRTVNAGKHGGGNRTGSKDGKGKELGVSLRGREIGKEGKSSLGNVPGLDRALSAS